MPPLKYSSPFPSFQATDTFSHCHWYPLSLHSPIYFIHYCQLQLWTYHLLPKISYWDQFPFFVFNYRLLPNLGSALIDFVIDSIIGPDSSLPHNGMARPYTCFITLLYPPIAGGIVFPTPHDLLWRWNMSRCYRRKGSTYVFHGLARSLCSGSAMRRAALLALAPVWTHVKIWGQTVIWIQATWSRVDLSYPARP